MKHWVDTLSLCDLLLLRTVLDEHHLTEDLEQDMQDLFLFPERLTESYPDEWRAYIKRKAKRFNLHADTTDPMANLKSDNTFVNEFRNAQPRYLRYSRIVKQIDALEASDRVTSIKTPLHLWLDSVLKNK